ncbi:MAG: DUF4382 domain-containing protein [Candidatus Aminicenantes bacterium]|nr:DUF4382 domain-containing protein [Candidatus Aminicenantes bacterium]
MKELIFFAISVALIFSACSMEKAGNFNLYLTDLPVDDAEEIWVTISEINVYKEEEGFITLSTKTMEYDLLELRNTEVLMLEAELSKGTYTQIRLVVDAGQIVIGGESIPMTVPSSEIKIPIVFNVMEDGTTEVLLDFDAEQSILLIQAGASQQFILRPVIIVKNISYSR